MTETSQARGFANARRETLSRRDGREPDYRWPGATPWGQQSPAVEEQAVPSAPPFGARGVQFAKTKAKSARGRITQAARRAAVVASPGSHVCHVALKWVG